MKYKSIYKKYPQLNWKDLISSSNFQHFFANESAEIILISNGSFLFLADLSC